MTDKIILKKEIKPVIGVRCNIEIVEKESKGPALSITGECFEACGQIQDEISRALSQTGYEPCLLMPKDTILEFLRIWNRWHLNDMNAACVHQKELWSINTICHFDIYNLKNEICIESQKIEAVTSEKLKRGESVKWLDRERLIQKLDYTVKVPSEPSLANEREKRSEWKAGTINEFYKYKGHETKACNWVYEKDHPFGILGKACPVCGYKYGSAWLYEPLPEEVIEFLKKL